MKKIFLLMTILLFAPFSVDALEPNYKVDGLYIDATIQTNGDMLVKEQIVLTGSFNGYIRDLSYKGEYSLYDASNLQLVKVCDLSVNRKGSFDSLDNSLQCFKEQEFANLGDSFVYTNKQSAAIQTLTMYNYNPSGTKIFYIEYLLSNVIVIHNDVAELYWTFIGNNFDDDIKDVKITVNLQKESSDLRVWAHGPLEGNISKESNKTITAIITDLYANNLVDIRATFDKDVVPYGSKLSFEDGLQSILAEEELRAEEANKEREKARIIYYGILGLSGFWIVGAIILAIYAYRKYDKEHVSDFKLEYHREFPAEYGPEVVEYLMKRKVTTVSLSAMILDIIRKKGFEVREQPSTKMKKQYVLIKKDLARNQLTADEAFIVDWFINDLGNGKEVALEDIKKVSKTEASAKTFMEKYDKWLTLAEMNGVREEFYEESLGFKIKSGLYCVLGFGIFIIAMYLMIVHPLTIMTLIIAIVLLIYTILFVKRTVKGNDHFVKWKAFKKFLLDFGRFEEKQLPEIVLWEKYLVYATVFGIAKKVYKAMEIKIKDMNINNDMSLYPILFSDHYFSASLMSTVNTARTASVSKIAESNMSSSSGGGGGFSGGGGFGGGGGGGGGRGF